MENYTEQERVERQTLREQEPLTAEPLHQEGSVPMKHSGPGIASFIVALAMFLLFVGLIIAVVAAVSPHIAALQHIPTQEELNSLGILPVLALLSIGMIACLVGIVVGLILGIIGLLQKNRKKVFAVIGTVMNGLGVGLLLLIVMISLAMRP